MNKTLLYICDPMCSWCWGFAPVFEELVRRYRDRVPIKLMYGGLRPGTRHVLDEQTRAYILHHWHAVHERTGQPFNFAFHVEPSFTYDTEPPSRAGVVVRQLAPEEEYAFLNSVQHAFYVENLDVTQEEVLADLAGKRNLNRKTFLEQFHLDAIRQAVWKEFEEARLLGVNAFPTLLGRDANNLVSLTRGYQSIEAIVPTLEEWLS